MKITTKSLTQKHNNLYVGHWKRRNKDFSGSILKQRHHDEANVVFWKAKCLGLASSRKFRRRTVTLFARASFFMNLSNDAWNATVKRPNPACCFTRSDMKRRACLAVAWAVVRFRRNQEHKWSCLRESPTLVRANFKGIHKAVHVINCKMKTKTRSTDF